MLGELQPPPIKSKRMSVTIKEHLARGNGNGGVMEAVEDLAGLPRLSNPSITAATRARLESRRVSTGPMALSMLFQF